VAEAFPHLRTAALARNLAVGRPLAGAVA